MSGMKKTSEQVHAELNKISGIFRGMREDKYYLTSSEYVRDDDLITITNSKLIDKETGKEVKI